MVSSFLTPSARFKAPEVRTDVAPKTRSAGLAGIKTRTNGVGDHVREFLFQDREGNEVERFCHQARAKQDAEHVFHSVASAFTMSTKERVTRPVGGYSGVVVEQAAAASFERASRAILSRFRWDVWRSPECRPC